MDEDQQQAHESDGHTADALERAGPRGPGADALALPREFTDVARFFRLDALWQVAQARSR